VRKNKMTGRGGGKRREPNAATKLAIREAQRREGLETFETVANWEKSMRRLSRGSAKQTKHN
jgi:hypothetical protein